MTGFEIYKRVLNISGYLNNGDMFLGEESLTVRIIGLINQVCLDLKIPKINSLGERIIAVPEKIDALCYGTAMLFALSEGNTEKSRLFTQIYNAKRTAVLSTKDLVEDTLPSVDCGG